MFISFLITLMIWRVPSAKSVYFAFFSLNDVLNTMKQYISVNVKLQLTFIGYLLCVGIILNVLQHFQVFYGFIALLVLQHCQVDYVNFTPQMEKPKHREVHNLPKVTQLLSERVKIHYLVNLVPQPVLFSTVITSTHTKKSKLTYFCPNIENMLKSRLSKKSKCLPLWHAKYIMDRK